MTWLTLVSLALLCCQVHCSTGDDDRLNHQACPAFFVYTDHSCHCGLSMDEETTLYHWTWHILKCHITANTTDAYLNSAYCMSYNESTGIVITLCPYNSCYQREENRCIGRGLRFIKIPRDPLLINDIMCGEIGRTGFLCSRCKEGLGPAVFHYGLPCVKCLGNTRGWLLYFTLAFLPSTLFFLLLTALQIHLSSASLNSMVLMCQLSVCSINGNPASYFSGVKLLHSFQTFQITMYGIWNLDFFRYVIPPFCISEDLTALQIVSLEYLVAVYPLILITVTYILIELHDGGCSVLISMWRPFHRCYTHFRRQWNPKTTIIHAFASFLLLSYLKIMVISTTLLRTTQLYNATFQKVNRKSAYIDPSLQLFDIHHAPYAALSLTTLFIFTVLPLLLLFLYPLRLTQRFFFIRANFLREVIQSLQGCYKDGTGHAGERDLRIFSAIFLFLRIIYVGVFILPNSVTISAGIIISFMMVPLVSFLKPYKEDWCNVWSSIVLLTIGTMDFAVVLSHILVAYIVMNILGCLPLLYMILLVLIVAVKKTCLAEKLKCICQGVTRWCPGNAKVAANADESLPYRLIMTEMQL